MYYTKENPLIINYDKDLDGLDVPSVGYKGDYHQYPSKHMFNNSNIRATKACEYYLGTEADYYTDEDVSYVLTEFFKDFFEDYEFKNYNYKLGKISDYLDLYNYKVKYESYLAREEHMYAKISLVNLKEDVLGVHLWTANNFFGKTSSYDHIVNNTFLNLQLADEEIITLIVSVLDDALNSQYEISNYGMKQFKHSFVDDGEKGPVKNNSTTIQTIKKEKGVLYGNIFVFDEKLSQPKHLFSEQVRRRDGEVRAHLSKTTNYFVTRNKKSPRALQAQALGAQVINEHKFRKML